MPLEQPRQCASLRGRIVDAGQHHVFERHAATILLVDVVPAGLEQFLDRVAPVDRHQLVAQFVVRRMQRHGQRDIGLFGQLVDLRHQPAGRQREASTREIKAQVIQQDVDGGQHIAEIGQRLAHAHQHDIADEAIVPGLESQFLLREKYLADDFRGASGCG